MMMKPTAPSPLVVFEAPRIARRTALRGLARGALGLMAGAALPLAGCASGEHDLDTFFILKQSPTGAISGWTKINLSVAPGADDQAVLTRVALYAPDGLSDLSFIISVLGQHTSDLGQTTPLVKGEGFPKNDTIGIMQVLYDQNIAPFFVTTDTGSTIKIDWSGQVDPNLKFPPNGFYSIPAKVTVDVA